MQIGVHVGGIDVNDMTMIVDVPEQLLTGKLLALVEDARQERVAEAHVLLLARLGAELELHRVPVEVHVFVVQRGDPVRVVDAIRPTIWDVRAVPLDERMLAAAARFPLVVTVEDGIAEGGIGSLITSVLGATTDDRGPRVVVLGTPLAYLPHGEVADLLAQLGLDGAGIAAAAVKALRDLERVGGAKSAGPALALPVHEMRLQVHHMVATAMDPLVPTKEPRSPSP